MAFHPLTIGNINSYTALIGVLAQKKAMLFSKRAGQVWVARDLPSNLPSAIYGEWHTEFVDNSTYRCRIAGLWRLSRPSKIYLPVNEMAKKLSVGRKDIGSSEGVFALVTEDRKLHVRFGGCSYRVKWERTSVTEIAVLTVF